MITLKTITRLFFISLAVTASSTLALYSTPPTESSSSTTTSIAQDTICCIVGQNALQGHRSTMEDTFSYRKQSNGRAFIGVFDGHGGPECAELLEKNFLDYLITKLELAGTINEQNIKQAFMDFDKEKCQCFENKGSTAVIAIIDGNTLWLAWVGDSRAVLAHTGKVEAYTQDHKALSLPTQKKLRIYAMGGFLSGPYLYNSQNQGLAVARTFGDFTLKQPNFLITAEPTVKKINPTSPDQFLILATDGLWDVMSNEEAVNLVNSVLQNQSMTPNLAQQAAQNLVNHAFSQNSQDNITAAVVSFTNKEETKHPTVPCLSSTVSPSTTSTPQSTGSMPLTALPENSPQQPITCSFQEDEDLDEDKDVLLQQYINYSLQQHINVNDSFPQDTNYYSFQENNKIRNFTLQQIIKKSGTPNAYQSAHDFFEQLRQIQLTDHRFNQLIKQLIPTETEMNSLAQHPNPAYRLDQGDDAVTVAAALGKLDTISITHTSHLHFGPMGSAAHYAVFYGKTDALQQLININPLYLDVMDGFNQTPLHLALKLKQIDCAQAITAAKINLLQQSLTTLHGAQQAQIQAEIPSWQMLQEALQQENFDLANGILLSREIPENVKNANNETALFHAVQNGDLLEVQRLLAIPGINVNAQDSKGWTALHKAITQKTSNLDIIKTLLAQPSLNINAQTAFGLTALHYAVGLYSSLDAAQALLATPGINVNAKAYSNATPLDEAVGTGNITIIQTLLDAPGIARTTVQHALDSLPQRAKPLSSFAPKPQGDFLKIAKVLQDFLNQQPTAPTPTASSSTPTPQNNPAPYLSSSTSPFAAPTPQSTKSISSLVLTENSPQQRIDISFQEEKAIDENNNHKYSLSSLYKDLEKLKNPQNPTVNYVLTKYGALLVAFENHLLTQPSMCSACQQEIFKAPRSSNNVFALILLKCGHIFHQPCLAHWNPQSQICPTCQQTSQAFHVEITESDQQRITRILAKKQTTTPTNTTSSVSSSNDEDPETRHHERKQRPNDPRDSNGESNGPEEQKQ